jgi:hypothetical protein
MQCHDSSFGYSGRLGSVLGGDLPNLAVYFFEFAGKFSGVYIWTASFANGRQRLSIAAALPETAMHRV